MTDPDYAALRAALKDMQEWEAEGCLVDEGPDAFPDIYPGDIYSACTRTEVIARLLAELDAARADAERYRWLRAHVSGQRKPASGRPAYFSFPGAMILPPLADIMKGSVAQHLDAAIDAAIEGEP